MRINRFTIWVPTVLLLFAALPLTAQVRDTTTAKISLRDSVFTETQVKRGVKAYEKYCIECHLPEQMTGTGFIDAWRGQTVYVLFEKIRTTMPHENPGRLKRKDCADVLAYLFSLNGLPTGKKDLPSSARKLKQIRIDTLPERREKK